MGALSVLEVASPTSENAIGIKAKQKPCEAPDGTMHPTDS